MQVSQRPCSKQIITTRNGVWRRFFLLQVLMIGREGCNQIKNRHRNQAVAFEKTDDLAGITRARLANQTIECVLIDEAQFLTRMQVRQLAELLIK